MMTYFSGTHPLGKHKFETTRYAFETKTYLGVASLLHPGPEPSLRETYGVAS